jgi:hypothetical protein
LGGNSGEARQPDGKGEQPRPAEPASDPAVKASWLKMAFPHAAAREEQIRQAARAMLSPNEPTRAGSLFQPPPFADATQIRAEPQAERATDMRPGQAETPPGPGALMPNASWQADTAAPLAGSARPRGRQQAVAAPKPALNATAATRTAPETSEEAERQWWTHEALDPLIQAVEAQDRQEFDRVFTEQIALVVSAAPSVEAVESHAQKLLTLGPQARSLQSLVKRATERFLVETPRRGAAEVERALQSGGPAGAASALRVLTDHETADPLTAGRLLTHCEKSMDAIAVHLSTAARSSQSELYINQGGASPAKEAYIGCTDLRKVFCDINAACDSGSRCEDGLRVMRRLARKMRRAPIDMFVTASIQEGDGVALPLEIVRLRVQHREFPDADALAFFIEVGGQELRQKTRGAVLVLEETAALLTEQMAKRGEHAPTGESSASQTLRDIFPELVSELDAQLAALDRYSYAFMRTVRNLESTEPWLERLANHSTLRKLAVPSQEDFPTLSFALGAMPGSVMEALRLDGPELLAPEVGGAYLRQQNSGSATQWFHDLRQFLGPPTSSVPSTAPETVSH